jgi:hypothetical protein
MTRFGTVTHQSHVSQQDEYGCGLSYQMWKHIQRTCKMCENKYQMLTTPLSMSDVVQLKSNLLKYYLKQVYWCVGLALS